MYNSTFEGRYCIHRLFSAVLLISVANIRRHSCYYSWYYLIIYLILHISRTAHALTGLSTATMFCEFYAGQCFFSYFSSLCYNSLSLDCVTIPSFGDIHTHTHTHRRGSSSSSPQLELLNYVLLHDEGHKLIIMRYSKRICRKNYL